MAYRDPIAERLAGRERQRRYRARQREKRTRATPTPTAPADPAGALADWSRDKLKVPAGHPLAGQPLTLPAYGVDFLRDALSHRESLLCLGRKNAKSAIVAVFLLGRLVGPITMAGWRGGVVSVTKEKAGELKRQMEEIATASGLEGLRFLRSPAPGRVASESGTLDILSADRSAGYASGFDESVIDEIGLLSERNRELVNGMRSATSARDGRFMALSIMGDAPFTREIVERQHDPAVTVHLYQPREDCELDDETAWHAANPGLAVGIKSLAYMRDEARRVLASPADQASFRAHDLNLPQDPGREMIVSTADWRACLTDDPPPRDGECVVGWDAGGSASMTALVAMWPRSGRMEAWGAFPAVPDALTRGAADGVGALYGQMVDRGEVTLYGGRVTPVAAFLADCAARLAGERVIAAGADRFRKAEAIQALESAGLRWPMEWRGQGASAVADGSHDVRAFQKRILARRLAAAPSLMMASAIAESSIRYDATGNPALEKGRARGRIDPLSAAVIAAGLADLTENRPRRRWRYAGAA